MKYSEWKSMGQTFKDEAANRLKAKIAKSTQRQVAKDLGISPQYLNDVLMTRRYWTDKLLRKVLN